MRRKPLIHLSGGEELPKVVVLQALLPPAAITVLLERRIPCLIIILANDPRKARAGDGDVTISFVQSLRTAIVVPGRHRGVAIGMSPHYG